MYIKKLLLTNYRNYENETFEFSSGINVLVGKNAQGKTNSAEALFFLCSGYSPRATKDKQVIKYGSDFAKVVGLAETRFGEVEVSIDFYDKSPKAVKVNGVPLKKIGELMGNINAVFFNPQDLKLIQESPEDRRRFMDISLCQTDKSYFYALSSYRKILEQRNNLIKSSDKETVYLTLPLWDEQLAKALEVVLTKRVEFIERLTPYVSKFHSLLTGNNEKIEISLDSSFEYKDIKTVKEEFIFALNQRLEKDMVLGYTGVGVHRDDLKIKINGEDVKIYGSQGQQRTCALSLKLAETELYKERFGEYPVLILDDALSELDSTRRERLLSTLQNLQTIITLTDLGTEFDNKNVNIIKVENGKIIK